MCLCSTHIFADDVADNLAGRELFKDMPLPLGQVVKEDGKEDPWRVVYEENHPDADTLEIPNLTPFTQYR